MHLITWLDYLGTALSLTCTLFYIFAKIQAWPFALMTIAINLILYFLTGLYGDVCKEFVYATLCIIGWYWWAKGSPEAKSLSISRLSFEQGTVLLVITLLAISSLAFVLSKFAHSKVPLWDAATTVLSLTAQWLVCRKILESWILWFVVDGLYVGLYFYKGLPAHGVLMLIYTGLAIVGYRSWRASQSRGTKYRSYSRASSVPDSGV